MSKQKTHSVQSVSLTHKLQNTPSRNQSESHTHKTLFVSNYYSCDPSHTNYSCFACLRRKQARHQENRQSQISHSKKQRNLGIYKLDEVIIKPWHPFLRILQGFFKNDKSKILDRYSNEENKLVLEFLYCLRSLRQQLVQSQCQLKYFREKIISPAQIELMQEINELIDTNYESILNNSLEKIEEFFSSSPQIQQHKPPTSLRTQILEQQMRNTQFRLKEAEKTLEMLSDSLPPTLKQTIQQQITLQKHMHLLERDLNEYRQEAEIYKKDFEQLREENYFLYYLARIDRHQIYLQLMKQYPQNLLQETEISYFELYLQTLESQISELKVNKARLTVQVKRLNSKETDLTQQYQGVYSTQVKALEEQWKQEQTALHEELQTLQAELQRAQRQEREVNGACMRIQNERDSVIQQYRVLQDQVNNMSQSILQLRSERDSLIKQLSQSRDTISQLQVLLEQKQEINAQCNEIPNESREALEKLCLIVLSKHDHLSPEQNQLFKKCLGEQAQFVIDQYEKVMDEQQRVHRSQENRIAALHIENEKCYKNVKNIKFLLSDVEIALAQARADVDKTIQQIQFSRQRQHLEKDTREILQRDNPEINTIMRNAIEKALNLIRSQDEKADRSLYNIQSHESRSCSHIVQSNTVEAVKKIQSSSRMTQTSENIMLNEDLNMMVLMQAIAIEEMIKTAEGSGEENFSDQGEGEDNNRQRQAKEFDTIMEQLNEEDEQNSDDELQQTQSVQMENLSQIEHSV